MGIFLELLMLALFFSFAVEKSMKELESQLPELLTVEVSSNTEHFFTDKIAQ